MKTIRKLILFIFGMCLFVELMGIPCILFFNHNYPGVISIKKYILWDLFALFVTYLIGIVFYELTHTKKEKNENKNR